MSAETLLCDPVLRHGWDVFILFSHKNADFLHFLAQIFAYVIFLQYFCSRKSLLSGVAHYLRLVAFRFHSLQFSGTEVRLNGSLMLRAGFNTHQLNFTQPAPIHRAG